MKHQRYPEAFDHVHSMDPDFDFDEIASDDPTAFEKTLDISEGSLYKNHEDQQHSLEIRRSIESHLEKRRLRKQLDYYLDDDFALDDE